MPRTNFVPSKHGFHFVNTFVNNVYVPFPPFYFQTFGLCGGMTLAALRYYINGIPIPTHTPADFGIGRDVPAEGTRLRNFIYDCQMASYGPLGLLSAVNWFVPPHITFDDQFNWSIKDEFPKIKQRIDSTWEPVVIGLRRRTDSPFGHQVLAIGYDENPKRVYIYDPNVPDREMSLTADEKNRRIIYADSNGKNSDGGETWSSWFTTDCNVDRARPPYIDLGLQEGITLRPQSGVYRVGEPLEIEFRVRNFGEFPAHVQQWQVSVRDPLGNSRDDLLGVGEVDRSPIAPGTERIIRRTCKSFGNIPGTYTIGASYLSAQGNLLPIPAFADGTRQTVSLNVIPSEPLPPIGSWRSLGGMVASPPTVGTNQDGRLEVFARGGDSRISGLCQLTRNVPGDYSGWELLPGEQTFRGPVSVVRNYWNKLEIFARGRDNAIWHRRQNDPNVREVTAWTLWSSLGGGLNADPTAVLNWDNRIEVFAIGFDNQVYHNWHLWIDAFGAPWSGWQALPGRLFKGRVAAEFDAEGRLHAVARSLDDTVWINYQTTRGGTWAGWMLSDGRASGDPVLTRNRDGRLEIFIRGMDGRLWHRWQVAPNGAWSNFQVLNESSSPQAYLTGEGRVAAIRNNAGGIEILALAGSREMMNIHQIPSFPYWSNWAAIGTNFTSDPAVGINPGGAVEVFTLGSSQELMHHSFSR